MRVKGVIMLLALHYWMGGAHHCSGPPSPKWPILCGVWR